MRNRAKCRLCEDIIESISRNDHVTCRCGEISVDGGNDYHRCRARDKRNFIILDDEGNEIELKEKPKEVVKDENPSKPTKKELIDMLKEMIKNIDNLPPNGMLSYVNQYDLNAVLILILSIFSCEENDRI